MTNTRTHHTVLSLLGLLLALLAVSHSAAAETRYVVDKLIITMRSGQSTQHQIIRT